MTRRTPAAVRRTGALRVIRDDDKTDSTAPDVVARAKGLAVSLEANRDGRHELDYRVAVAAAERILRDLRRSLAS